MFAFKSQYENACANLFYDSLGHLTADPLRRCLATLLRGGLARVRVVADGLLHLLASAVSRGNSSYAADD